MLKVSLFLSLGFVVLVVVVNLETQDAKMFQIRLWNAKFRNQVILCGRTPQFERPDWLMTIEAAEGKMLQGENQRPISQKPRPGPLPPGKLFTSAACL